MLRVVTDICETGLDPSRWSSVLAGLKQALNADAAAFAWHDFANELGGFDQMIAIPQNAATLYRVRFAIRNPWLAQQAAFRNVGAVIRGSDMVRDDAIAGSEFYRDWLRPFDLLHPVFIVLDQRGDCASYLMVTRGEKKGPFKDDDIDRLSVFAPEIARAYRAGQRARRAQELGRAALDSLDAMPVGMAILNANGGVVSANRMAAQVIEAGEGLYVANGGLAIDHGGRRLKMSDIVARAIDSKDAGAGAPPPAFSASRHTGQRPLTVMVTPIRDRQGGSCEDPVAVMYVGDPERPVTFDPSRISQLYGLSRAEARVAALLASGYRLEQAAEILGIAYETVRKHLKQIFGKTGTYRQAELVRVLVTGPGGLSL